MSRIETGDEDRNGHDGVPFARPFLLPGARSHVLQARSIPGRYRIDLAVPAAAPPPAGWPLLLLLDAEGAFATAVEALRRMARRPDATGVLPLVVAGVSALGKDEETGGDVSALRRRDFTTVRPDVAGSGGAAGFLGFLADEVLPLLGRAAPLDSLRRTLFGHSLGGYFALLALADGAAPFSACVAVSPSVWWDMDGLAVAIGRLDGKDRRALVLAGAFEDELPPWQQRHPGHEEVRRRRAARQLPARARAVAQRLAAALGAEHARFELLAGEDHASIISAALPRALRLSSGN